MLSIGALLTAACGDGTIGGPLDFENLTDTQFRIDPNTVAGLGQIGGRVVVTTPQGGNVLVERVSTTVYRGFSLACPHAGTTVEVQSSGFSCPNHGARFSTEGVWLGGQPTSDLIQVGVALQSDGSLLVGGPYIPPAPPVLAISATSISFVLSTTAASPPQSVVISNSGGGSLGGLTIALSYTANQPTGWLTVALNQTTAPATLSVTAARGSLPFGTYTAAVRVTSPETGAASVTLNVTVVVQDPNAAPALQLSASALAFNASRGANPAAQTVQLVNSGGGALSGIGYTIAYGAGASTWLSTSSLSGTSAPASITIRPESSTLAAGTYTATITITATGVVARTIGVTLTVVSTGLSVTIANYPALANVGGVAGSVGTVAGAPVAIARISQTSFAAFNMRCPHAGTTINVVGTTSFRCPNHGALFTNSGKLASNSPLRTSDLLTFTVRYTPGDTVLFVS